MIALCVKLLGDSGSGKTCTLISYTTQSFPSGEYIPKVFQNYFANVMVDGRPFILHLHDCDTSKELEHTNFTSTSIPDVFLIVMDITNGESFRNIHKWSDQIKLYNAQHKKDIPYLLVGSKTDKRESNEFIGNICHLLDAQTADVLVYGFCRNFTSNDDIIGICFRFYYDSKASITAEQGKDKALEIGATLYVEHSALTQEGLKNVFDSAIREGYNYKIAKEKKTKCLIQ